MPVAATDELDASEELENEQLGTPAVEETPAAEVADVETTSDDVETGLEQPAFGAETLELASRTGLDPTDYKDEAAFYRAVVRYDRAVSDWQRQSSLQRQPTPEPAKPAEVTPQALKRLELEKYFKAGPDGEIDPAIVEAFKAIHGDYYTHLDGLQQKLSSYDGLKQEFEELKQYRQQEEQRRFVDEWDGFFAQVGDDYKVKVGSGSLHDVSPSHLKVRDDIVSTAIALRQVDEARGLRPLSNKQYGQRALLSVLGTETNAIARKEILNQAKKRTGAALAGTNGKQVQPKTPEDRAWRVFKEQAKKVGLGNVDED